MRKTTLLKMMLLAGAFTMLSMKTLAQVSITNSSTITESLTTFKGTVPTVPANWTLTGTGTSYDFRGTAATTGTAGGWYGNGFMSFLGSSKANDANATLLLKNNTNLVITGFTLSFTAKMYRSVALASPVVSVSWSNNSVNTNPNSGDLANVLSSLSFSDATPSISAGTTLSQTVSNISIANGEYIFIRFVHPGGSNSDNLGWDEITFTPNTLTTLTTAEASVPDMSTTVGTPVTQKVTISGANLTGDVMLSVTGDAEFSVAPASITPTSGSVSSVEATITYSPTAAGTNTAVLTISSPGATSVVFNLSGTASVVTNVTDVTESDLNIYKDGSSLKFNTLLAGETVSVYNSVGQKISSQLTINGLNTINLNNTKGLVIVKVGNKTAKVVL